MISATISIKALKLGQVAILAQAVSKLEALRGSDFTDEEVNELTNEFQKYKPEINTANGSIKMNWYDIPGFGDFLRIGFENGKFSLFRVINT